MHLYDIHAHLADERILPDAGDILRDAEAAGVRGILVNAARLSEWDAVRELSRHRIVYGALGVHPFFVDAWRKDSRERLRSLLSQHRKIVAIGEIGLDFWEDRRHLESQMRVFRSQLALAHELDVPVILHNRKSWGECLGLFKEEGYDCIRGVCHCFNGSRELARQLLDRGLMISFGGPLTSTNATRMRDVAAYVPADRILTETDSPDLPPRQIKPEKSLPQHVRFVLEALAEIRRTSADTLAAQIERNVRNMIGLNASTSA